MSGEKSLLFINSGMNGMNYFYTVGNLIQIYFNSNIIKFVFPENESYSLINNEKIPIKTFNNVGKTLRSLGSLFTKFFKRP